MSPSPRENDWVCGYYLSLNENLGFVINCDSGGLINLAQDPSSIFKEGELLQSRPGIVPIGIIFSIPISIVTTLTNLAPFTYTDSFLINTNIFLGFVLFNFSLLFLSLLLFIKISGYLKLSRLITLSGLLLISLTPITKTFLLTPHLQLFNIFVPLFSLFILVKGLNNRWHLSSLYLLALTTSFFTLIYPSFILSLVSILLVYILQDDIKIFEIKKIIKLRRLLNIILLTLISILPTLVWPVIVKHIAGFYFNHASETYRQFVWIFDGFSSGLYSGITNIIFKFQKFTSSFNNEFIVTIIILLIFILISVSNKKTRNILVKFSSYILLIISFLLFFFTLGYYVDRLLFNITLLVQIVILLIANEYINNNKQFRLIPIILLALTLIKIFILAIEHGPYS